MTVWNKRALCTLLCVILGTQLACAQPVESQDMAGGMFHSVVVRSDGTLWAWGRNNKGQLGDGSFEDSNSPVQVLGIAKAVQMRCGSSHSLALMADGSVYAWGSNDYGQLGNGKAGLSFAAALPAQVSGLPSAKAIACGSEHNIAIVQDNKVWAWGKNSNGQLGDDSTIDRNLPVEVLAIDNVIAVAAGTSHSLALKGDGTVWAWGRNDKGQLGNGTTTDARKPTQISGLTGIVSIATGANHCLALQADGSVWGWGSNDNGQLGVLGSCLTSPMQVEIAETISAILAYGNHSMAVADDGMVWAWGKNNVGQLGLEPTASISTPTRVLVLEAMDEISLGYYHGLGRNGTCIVSWGYNYYGQLGNGTNKDSYIPVDVVEDVIAVESIEVSPSELLLRVGESTQLSVNILPVNATNQAVEWHSNNEETVRVDENGMVQAAAPGCATVRAITEDGSMSDSCLVTVGSVLGGYVCLYGESAHGGVRVTAYRDGAAVSSTLSLANGAYSVQVPREGTYHITFSRSGYSYVKKLNVSVALGETATISETELHSLDINSDGIQNQDDLNCMTQLIGTRVDSAEWDATVDFNGDGYINALDILQFVSGLGVSD